MDIPLNPWMDGWTDAFFYSYGMIVERIDGFKKWKMENWSLVKSIRDRDIRVDDTGIASLVLFI